MNNSVSHASTDFVVFAIENTAKRLGIPGSKVYQALQSSNGIQDFLYPSYPTLHTQGKEYIVDEVLEYLKEHHAAITSREKELWEYIMVQQPK